jgi:glycosyltransferase involved in cell wall biosynthesis
MELALPAVAQIDFPVTLKLLGVRSETEEKEIRDYFKHNSNVTLSLPRNLDWQDEHSIYEHIKTFDVGLAPLLDTEFNRGKSAFKAKQCLSCGVPVLASSVGENKVFVKNGINGYHCDTPAQYLEKIHLVHSLPAKSYQQLSAAAAASFDTFSIDHFCNTIVGYFERAGNASALMASSKTAWKD